MQEGGCGAGRQECDEGESDLHFCGLGLYRS